MKKLRLDLSELCIESFDPLIVATEESGTVRGFESEGCYPTLENCPPPTLIACQPTTETEVETCYTVCASCEGMNTCYTGCGGCPTDGGAETCAEYVTCDGGHFCD